MKYDPTRAWNIELTDIVLQNDNEHILYVKVPIAEALTTSEVFASEEHIDPLRDDGFIIYRYGPIGPNVDGVREVRTLWNGRGGFPDAPSDGKIYGRKDKNWVEVIGGGAAANSLDYTIFISQTGTNAPTIIELENTIGAIVATRYGVGTTNFTLPGAFVVDKTTPIDDIMMDQAGNLFTLNRISADVMELKTFAAANLSVAVDGILNKRYINISVYL